MDEDSQMEEGEVCSSNEHSNDEASTAADALILANKSSDSGEHDSTKPMEIDGSFNDDRLVIDLPDGQPSTTASSAGSSSAIGCEGKSAADSMSPIGASVDKTGKPECSSSNSLKKSAHSPAKSTRKSSSVGAATTNGDVSTTTTDTANNTVNNINTTNNEEALLGDTEEDDEHCNQKAGTSGENSSTGGKNANSHSAKSNSAGESSRKRAAASSSADDCHSGKEGSKSAGGGGGSNSTSGGQPPRRKKKLCSSSRDTPNPKIARTQNMRKDACTWVRSIATEIDPDSLGACEPGTHVNLDGIVWNETDNGLLVVNVTWRGKSYMGTLLDCTRFDWAPPRLCESPLMELTPAKGRSGKRGGRNNNNTSHLSAATSASSANLQDLRRQNSHNNNHMKSSKSTSKLSVNVKDEDDDSSQGVLSEQMLEPLSPVMRQCPCKSCNKEYTNDLALKFHQNSSHPPVRPDTPPRLLPPQPQHMVSPIQKQSSVDKIATSNVPSQSVSPRVLNKQPVGGDVKTPLAAAAAANATAHNNFKTGNNNNNNNNSTATATTTAIVSNSNTASTSADVASHIIKTEAKTEDTLSPKENESLQMLFRVVNNGQANATTVNAAATAGAAAAGTSGAPVQDFPKLEATTPVPPSVIKGGSDHGGHHSHRHHEHDKSSTKASSVAGDERATSRSPAAYSDISDDAAPVLEKEVPTNPPASVTVQPIINASPTVSKVSTLGSSSSKLSSSSSSSKSVAVVQPQCSHQPSPSQQPDLKPPTADGQAGGPEDAVNKAVVSPANMMAAAMVMPRASMPTMMATTAGPPHHPFVSAPGFMPPGAFMSPYGLQPMMMMPGASSPHQMPHHPLAAHSQPHVSHGSPSAITTTTPSNLHKIHELKSSSQSNSLSPQQHSVAASGSAGPHSKQSGSVRTDTPPVQRHHHIHQHNMMPYFAPHHFSSEYAMSMLSQQTAAAAAAMQNSMPPK